MTVVADNLIFGCSTITQQATLKESLRLLATASDLGIVHFDTARTYGSGESETILGRHLKGRRDGIIVTTKYGFAPPIANERVARAYARATAVERLTPPLRILRRVRRAVRPSLFSSARIRANLEVSLRELGTDYVDYLLLHEASTTDARRRAVTQTLAELVQEGKVRQFGVGSAYSLLRARETLLPESYRVLQFEHNPLAKAGLEAGPRPGRLIFTHSALAVMRRVAQILVQQPALVRRFSHELDVDATSPALLPGLLLAYSHAKNTRGKVIFSTRSPQRLAANVRTFSQISDWAPERLRVLQLLFDDLTATPSLDPRCSSI